MTRLLCLIGVHAWGGWGPVKRIGDNFSWFRRCERCGQSDRQIVGGVP